MKWLDLGKTFHNSTYNYLFIFRMMFILIMDIVFILSPSLPKVRVRVTSETETARSGPGRQEKDWPGPERGRAARWELYYYRTLTCSSGLAVAGGWWAWPGSSRAGCQTGQGSTGPRAQAVWAPADFPGTGWTLAQLQVTQTPPRAQDWFHSGQPARHLLALPEK